MRIFGKNTVYHVTNRTNACQYLLVPDEEFNRIARRIVRQGVRMYDIDLYALVVMSNHFHMVLSAPKGTLSAFMCYVQSRLARAVNKLRKRTGACVFYGSFKVEPVLDEESFERILEYVWNNPVRANMVRHAHEHPGVSTYAQSAGMPVTDEIPLAIPPMWRHLDDSERVSHIQDLVRTAADTFNSERQRPVLGARKCQAIPWTYIPANPKPESPLDPLCHATRPNWEKYRRLVQKIKRAYRAASRAWRAGKEAVFPHGTFPPGRSWYVKKRDRFVLPKEWQLGRT